MFFWQIILRGVHFEYVWIWKLFDVLISRGVTFIQLDLIFTNDLKSCFCLKVFCVGGKAVRAFLNSRKKDPTFVNLKICCLNPFPHTTILQQTTLNVFCQNIEIQIEWITYDKKWKTLWQKEKLHVLCNFFFCRYVFRKRLYEGKG